MPLTEIEIRKTKPVDKPVKLPDGRGLYLLINPTGSKLWRWKYRVDGKEKLMTLGAYPALSLAQARMRHEDERRLLQAGTDPMAQRKADKQARQLAADNSFATVAAAWWQSWKTARSERHAEYVLRRLNDDVFPAIGARPIAQIEAPELVRMVKAIETRGALDIAKRALQTCGQVFRYAIAHGLATRNPAADIKPGDILASRKKENYARLDAKELPELMRRIEGYQGTPTTRLALKLIALTFVRTSELIGARWKEFDLAAARWDIPAERMKMKTPHVVPLSTQAVEVLRTLQLLTGNRELLFPGERDHGKPMSNNTILKALARMGYQYRMTGHGFRGVASTLLHEMDFQHAHIEIQLAHQERNAVSASYNHAQYLQQRAVMMQSWGDYLENCTKGPK
ncbi:MAG: tyrosine-type recombinase/integrase [Hydrogenophaga sp.]|jgi:integrase|nr:tyrosine-type recombinase/integrase [Hydrogenophaga sp.]